jgi:hypothetical protein
MNKNLVTDSFFANCRTHHLLCCGVAIFETSGIQRRQATTITQVL